MKKLLLLLLIPCITHAQTQSELKNFLQGSAQDYQITGAAAQLTLNNNITLAAAGSSADDIVSGGAISYRSVNIQIVPASGTVTAGAITFEGSNDNFVSAAMPVYLYDLASITAAPVTNYTVVASTPRYFGGNIYFKYFRARISTGITGTTTGVQAFVTYKATPFTPVVPIVAQPTAGNMNGTVAISGTPSVNATPVTYATNSTTPTAVNSAASNNAAFLKASAGILYSVCANNTTASAKFVRIYNKTSAPTVGTDVPVLVITIPANSSKEIIYPVGLKFATGIAYAITGGGTISDNTSTAVADVQALFNWQ